jgi:hypothetical protein
VLLDDVLAALVRLASSKGCLSADGHLKDVHTARWIVEKCLRGDLLRGRTVLLVVRAPVSPFLLWVAHEEAQTHNVALASPVAQYVVCMDGGRVKSHGSLSDTLAADAELMHAVEAEEEAREQEKNELQAEKPVLPAAEPVPAPAATSGKLVAKEEMGIGHIGFDACKCISLSRPPRITHDFCAVKLFLFNVGGGMPVLWWVGFLATVIITKVMSTWDDWYLGMWLHVYTIVLFVLTISSFRILGTTVPDAPRLRGFRNLVSVQDGAGDGLIRFMADHPCSYLGTWAALVVGHYTLQMLYSVYYTVGSLRASRVIHQQLIGSIMRSTFRWLGKIRQSFTAAPAHVRADVTPTSRLLARATQDIQAGMSAPILLLWPLMTHILESGWRRCGNRSPLLRHDAQPRHQADLYHRLHAYLPRPVRSFQTVKTSHSIS